MNLSTPLEMYQQRQTVKCKKEQPIKIETPQTLRAMPHILQALVFTGFKCFIEL